MTLIMNESVLLGKGKEIVAIPQSAWEGHLDQAPEHSRQRLAFMSEAHHQIRYFVVRELPRYGKPIPPGYLSQELEIPLEQVLAILDELEKNLVFLVRDDGGDVAWAFPVTVDDTPHEISFSTGERLNGA